MLIIGVIGGCLIWAGLAMVLAGNVQGWGLVITGISVIVLCLLALMLDSENQTRKR